VPRFGLSAAALACTLAVAGCSRSAAPPVSRPNVLLITIDTLRADRLGRGLTPTLDLLAARGLEFTGARAAVPLTLPSHATIMTGLLPPHHGCRLNGTNRLSGHETLATLLRAHGYHTAAVVGAFVVGRTSGLAEGFEQFDDNVRRDPRSSTALEAERPAEAVTTAVLAAAGARKAEPWFQWVHYYDPHAPYTPPPDFLKRAAGHPYDGEVAYADTELRRLLEGVLPHASSDTIVVVAGDHGESLGEHGEATHGLLLYEAALRVPLIVARFGRGLDARPAVPLAHEIRREPVSLADVAPTILAALSVPAPAGVDGISLLGPPKPERDLYAETLYPRVAGWSPLTALVAAPWKLIRGGRRQLFDLSTDAREGTDRSGDRAAVVSGMETTLRQLTAGAVETTSPLAPEARERLRALGYVAGSAPPPAAPTGAPDPADRTADWRAFEAASEGVAAGHLPDSIRTLSALAARNPGSQAFHTAWARALGLAGRRQEALDAYRTASARWTGDAALMHDLAVAARDANQPDEARRAEQAALTIDATMAAAHNGLGLLDADAGRVADAETAFARAASLDPADPSYLTNLGNAQRARGALDAARQAYERALTLDRGWPDAANGIGVLEVQAGRPAAAIAWFEQALARMPDFVEARLNLGIACQDAGQPVRARAVYQEVLRTAPPHARERDAARTLLRSLR
jgi:arylsulfatase A-like enzyme/tetratricopeptide (TPR) repeat protein